MPGLIAKKRDGLMSIVVGAMLLLLPPSSTGGPAWDIVRHRGNDVLQHIEGTDRKRPESPTQAVADRVHGEGAQGPSSAAAAAKPSMRWDRHRRTVVGALRRHRVKAEETLLDIARHYDLGYNEMEDLYPSMDPWLPPAGATLTIPTQWVLPDSHAEELVVNIPELRLYRFRRAAGTTVVETFPVGIGNVDWPTPTGQFRIDTKVVDPTWIIPPALRPKYGRTSIPPGPHNPLGRYWLGLGESSYGIHGTDIPWSVGRLVTRGCIRLYPEDIAYLFESLKPPVAIRLIYEPVKIGRRDGRIYVEAHEDVYGRIADFAAYGFERLRANEWRHSVDAAAFEAALQDRTGMPVDVTAPSITKTSY